MLLKSDWCLLLIVSAMFLVGMWLIIVEVPPVEEKASGAIRAIKHFQGLNFNY